MTILERWDTSLLWYDKAADKLKPWYNALSKERQAEVMKSSQAAAKEMDKVLDDYVKEEVDLETMKNAIRKWYKVVKGL